MLYSLHALYELHYLHALYAQLRGYDDEANLQGRCLHNAATHEIDTTSALEQVNYVGTMWT